MWEIHFGRFWRNPLEKLPWAQQTSERQDKSVFCLFSFSSPKLASMWSDSKTRLHYLWCLSSPRSSSTGSYLTLLRKPSAPWQNTTRLFTFLSPFLCPCQFPQKCQRGWQGSTGSPYSFSMLSVGQSSILPFSSRTITLLQHFAISTKLFRKKSIYLISSLRPLCLWCF